MTRLFLAVFVALFAYAPAPSFAGVPSFSCVNLAFPQAAEARHRKCDSDADCPGFANSCFAGTCTSNDSNQCNSDSDCPGFANSCFAGHCTSKDDNQCNSDKDCPGFANSCFAGHCTNP